MRALASSNSGQPAHVVAGVAQFVDNDLTANWFHGHPGVEDAGQATSWAIELKERVMARVTAGRAAGRLPQVAATLTSKINPPLAVTAPNYLHHCHSHPSCEPVSLLPAFTPWKSHYLVLRGLLTLSRAASAQHEYSIKDSLSSLRAGSSCLQLEKNTSALGSLVCGC